MPMTIPTIEDLTDSQLEIQDLPISGRYLITGGPGSGKTSIAIRRTEFIKKDNPKASVHSFLFTNTLNDFFGDGIRSLKISPNVEVWAKWQRRILISNKAWPFRFNDAVPWDTLSDRILELKLDTMYDHLIIDEAQDFNELDLRVMSMIAENITVFADENQRLYDKGIEDVDAIRRILMIDEDDCYHLQENHRNTKEIMASAVSLAPDEIDIDPAKIVKTNQKPRIIMNRTSDTEIEFITRVVKSNPQKDIGILHLEKSVIRSLYTELTNGSDGSTNYELIKKDSFDFSKPGPKLCTLNSAKGLEFDIVIMPRMNRDNYFEHVMNLKRIYVGMTRAREDLMLSYVGAFPTTYLSKIDPNTIRRIENQ